MAAFLFLKDRRDKRRLHSLLYVVALGSSKNGKEIQKQLEKWEREI